MPIPVVTAMLVREIRVSAVPVTRHAWRFGTAWRLAKAVDIPGRSLDRQFGRLVAIETDPALTNKARPKQTDFSDIGKTSFSQR